VSGALQGDWATRATPNHALVVNRTIIGTFCGRVPGELGVSSKTRGVCPSCAKKRQVAFSRLLAEELLSIHRAAVTYSIDSDDPGVVIHRVQNPVASLPDSVAVFHAYKSPRAWRSGALYQVLDGVQNTFDLNSRKVIQLTTSRITYLDFVDAWRPGIFRSSPAFTLSHE